MTRVSFILKRGRIVGFRARGHSGYAQSGQDIICAAVSALTQTCELGLTDVMHITPVIERDDERGRYTLTLPRNIAPAKLRRAQLLFRTLELGLRSIAISYPKYVRIGAKERRWN